VNDKVYLYTPCFTSLDALHSAMFTSSYILLEHHYAQLHENFTDIVEVETEEEIWIQDNVVHILI
jgi:hypothetical protein